MAPFIIVDKMIASVFLLVLFNVNQGQCNFYQPLAIGRPEGQQALFEINEPQNRVGYSYKPAWADIHFQPFLEDTHHQQQSVDRIQQQLTPSYTVPAHTYLQSSDKYQISPPKYQWSVQPSVYQNIPSISNPLFPREPQQQSANVLVPLRLFGVQSFPPFLERLIQRVQTYYSIYNPPDTLTIPHNINTPPTFTASSLLPPFDSFFPTDNNEENTPNIDINSVENNEETTELVNTTEFSPDSSGNNNESSTEESTATDSKAEDSTKADSEESTTASSSTDEKTTSKKLDESDNETTTAASEKDDESLNLTEEPESTARNIDNGISDSTEAKEDDQETTTTSS